MFTMTTFFFCNIMSFISFRRIISICRCKLFHSDQEYNHWWIFCCHSCQPKVFEYNRVILLMYILSMNHLKLILRVTDHKNKDKYNFENSSLFSFWSYAPVYFSPMDTFIHFYHIAMVYSTTDMLLLTILLFFLYLSTHLSVLSYF